MHVKDQYEDALKELPEKKQSGQKIEAPRDREPSKVVYLMNHYAVPWKRNVVAVRDANQQRERAIRRLDVRAQDRKKLAEMRRSEHLIPLILVGFMVAIAIVMIVALIWPEHMPFYRHLSAPQ